MAEPLARPFLSAVVLAAGASMRMGRPKPLLPLGGKCLLGHVLDAALGSTLDEVVLVLGDRAAEIEAALRLPQGARVRTVVNSAHAEGQSTSLRLGLRSTDPRAVAAAVLLGDQPGVDARLIDRVVRHFLETGAAVARPSFATVGGGRRPGHPVILARRVWSQVARLTGDQGARRLIADHPEWLSELALAEAPPPDVDTPEDYERLVRTFS